MPTYHEETDRYYLDEGDEVEARPVALSVHNVKDKYPEFELEDLADSDLEYYDREDEEWYTVHYDWAEDRPATLYYEK